MTNLIKYPRTRHIEGSRLQPGDEDLESVPFSEIAGKQLVIEEKIDGANSGLSFSGKGHLLLQSRGHFLQGGGREAQFALFKTWATVHQSSLQGVLGCRYIMYGEWMYAKHTVFYDALPHYFMEFDIYDAETNCFLSTAARRKLCDGLPVVSVPVIRTGMLAERGELSALITTSLYKTPGWRSNLQKAAEQNDVAADLVLKQTDPSDDAEGLYIKVEDDEKVLGRFKFVRQGFCTQILDSESHWSSRRIVPNQLAPEADMFAVTS